MNTKRIAFISAFGPFVCFALAATGCASKTDNDDTLSASESALVADSDEADDAEAEVETGIEEPLSGAPESDPGSPPDPSTPDADLGAAVKTNPGRFFQPAGCITTTWDVATKTATHVFNGCTGPAGLRGFNGTITSTWARGTNELSVKHSATDFKINGATLSGTVNVKWTKSGTTYTKTRDASWTGKTKSGKDIERTVKHTATYDASSKCVTREGTASTAIGGRSFDSSISGYERCGVGSLGCPQSGKIVLTATKQSGSATLTIEFTGGRGIKVTRPNGAIITGEMKFCRAT